MIVVLQLLVTNALALLQFRWALSAFVFFLAFSPRSLGLSFSENGAVLTFPRIAFPLIVFIFVISRIYERGNGHRYGNYFLGEPVFKALFVFSLLQLTASLVNGVTPVYALDSILATLVAFVVFFSASSEQTFDSILKAFLVAGAVTFVVVLIEFPAATPLHYAFADQSLLDQGGLKTRERGGFYRAQGFFDNPLGLAEFIVYLLPVAAYKMMGSVYKFRYMAIFAALFLIILATGSRSGILAFTASALTFWVSYNWFKMSGYSRIFLGIILTFLFVFSLFWAFGLVLALGEQAQNASFFLMDDAERSTLGRAMQYLDVYSALADRPFFGFGVLQNFADQLEQISRIDNYILRTGLEAGFPGMLAFIYMLYKIFRRGSKINRESTVAKERALRAFVLSLLVGFTLMKLFVSIPLNNIMFFSLMGLALGFHTQQRKLADAHPPSSQ